MAAGRPWGLGLHEVCWHLQLASYRTAVLMVTDPSRRGWRISRGFDVALGWPKLCWSCFLRSQQIASKRERRCRKSFSFLILSSLLTTNSVLVMMAPPASNCREVLARELHRCLFSQSYPSRATARHASQPLYAPHPAIADSNPLGWNPFLILLALPSPGCQESLLCQGSCLTRRIAPSHPAICFYISLHLRAILEGAVSWWQQPADEWSPRPVWEQLRSCVPTATWLKAGTLSHGLFLSIRFLLKSWQPSEACITFDKARNLSSEFLVLALAFRNRQITRASGPHVPTDNPKIDRVATWSLPAEPAPVCFPDSEIT
jgi:hypothetical protein